MRVVLSLLLALLLATGCERAAQNVYHQQLFAFGTLIEITLYGVEEDQARQAVQAVEAMYQRQHRDWHAWQRGMLMDLNEAMAAGKTIHTDPSITRLIRLGQDFERSSGGLFNPAIGHLLNLWGFQQDDAPQGPPPPEADIRRWLDAAPSSLQVQIQGQQVYSENPAVRLDFGGFAKGYSVGKAVELLSERGIDNLIVNAGGDLCVRGRHGDRPWRVGIRRPGASGLLASIEMENAGCIFTSGNYERFYDYRGRRYHHILDPRNGYPAAATASVTVMTGDPTLADAAATALFVAGPDNWQDVAARMGIQDVLLVDENNAAQLTPGFAERVYFEQQPATVKIVQINP
ncbi:MAG: FAD:protein FMN transferase [Thiogranum sp.]